MQHLLKTTIPFAIAIILSACGNNNNPESKTEVAFCPMAFNDKGASWISGSKEIRNPYFGEKNVELWRSEGNNKIKHWQDARQ